MEFRLPRNRFGLRSCAVALCLIAALPLGFAGTGLSETEKHARAETWSQVELGMTLREVEKRLGAPDRRQGSKLSWRVSATGTEYLVYLHRGQVTRTEQRWDTPVLPTSVIPTQGPLTDYRRESGRDHESPWRMVGIASQGRIWRLQPDGRVASEIRISPWKSSERGVSLTKLLGRTVRARIVLPVTSGEEIAPSFQERENAE